MLHIHSQWLGQALCSPEFGVKCLTNKLSCGTDGRCCEVLLHMCISCSTLQHYMQANIHCTKGGSANNVYISVCLYLHISIFVYMFVGYCLLLAKMHCRSLSMSNLLTGPGQDGMQGAVQGGMQGGGQGGGESACVVVNVCTSTLHSVPPLPILTLAGSPQSNGASDADLSKNVYGEWVTLLMLGSHLLVRNVSVLPIQNVLAISCCLDSM